MFRSPLSSLAILGLIGCASAEPGALDPIDADPGVDSTPGTPDASPAPDAFVVPTPDAPPGCAAETCDDGMDNDCDGLVDNGCYCAPGATEPCFTGPPESRWLGECADGVTTCEGESSGELGVWGPCEGDVLPQPESCDAAGLDEDCDGAPNDGCECAAGDPPVPCGSDVGACVPGEQVCVDGVLGPCTGGVGPIAETCDGLDEDCNGLVDDGLFMPCGSSEGACEPGTSTCFEGSWLPCEGATDPVDEWCNGVDDDCDGVIDDGTAMVCGSEIGACATGLSECTAGAYGDCLGELGPVAETCNGLDDDCDGPVDEELVEGCGLDVGTCVPGTRACAGGVWGACLGGIGPVTEACNTLDDDCDGVADEGCLCVDGQTASCGSDVGACVAGTQLCTGGAWGPCEGDVGPMLEACNGVDDDCNGTVDDGLTMACGTEVGSCTAGVSTCTAGAWGPCAGSVGPVDESCNNLDDDCDGATDEALVQPCGTDAGACVAGTQACSAGVWGGCTGEVGPSAETCNGIDDDCDASTDEGLTLICGTDVGACTTGVRTCTGGGWGDCVGDIEAAAETCNALDDDCDGTVDEGCGCVHGTTQACGSDVGACVAGTQTCQYGVWGPCLGEIGPAAETCNAADDDCDGTADESLTQACGTDTGACTAGVQTCSGGAWGTCVGSIGPTGETCNALDDDCDGTVDESLTQPCGIDTGVCVSGTQTCSMGAWGACAGEVPPTPEICNNQDDDCDGTKDESLTQACGTDTGVCVAGTQTCSHGSWDACSGAVGPGVESCNNLDDDCDGPIDESLVQSCGIDTGACVAGTQTCATGAWGACTGGVGPIPEVCGNHLDDDCDGSTDTDCSQPPIVTCPADISTTPLTTVSLSGSGSDPDGGTVTYLWTVTSAPPGSASTPSSPTSATTAFWVDLAGTYTLTFTVTDDEGQTASCTVTIVSIPPQDLHVELTWDASTGDVDLHMTEAGVTPASAWYMPPATGESACWYQNTTAAWPPASTPGDATLDHDDTYGYGPENINIVDSPASGTYGIGVAYYCDGGYGATTATVNVYCGGLLAATYPGIVLSGTGVFVDVARVTWPGCAGTSIMSTTTTALVQPAYFTSPVHCSISCTHSSDCPAGEVCGTYDSCELD